MVFLKVSLRRKRRIHSGISAMVERISNIFCLVRAARLFWGSAEKIHVVRIERQKEAEEGSRAAMGRYLSSLWARLATVYNFIFLKMLGLPEDLAFAGLVLVRLRSPKRRLSFFSGILKNLRRYDLDFIDTSPVFRIWSLQGLLEARAASLLIFFLTLLTLLGFGTRRAQAASLAALKPAEPLKVPPAPQWNGRFGEVLPMDCPPMVRVTNCLGSGDVRAHHTASSRMGRGSIEMLISQYSAFPHTNIGHTEVHTDEPHVDEPEITHSNYPHGDSAPPPHMNFSPGDTIY